MPCTIIIKRTGTFLLSLVNSNNYCSYYEAREAWQVPLQSKLRKHHGARKVSQTKWFKPAGITNSALSLCEIKQRRQGGWMLWTLTATLTRLKHN